MSMHASRTVDVAVERLRRGETRWAQTPLASRRQLLDQIRILVATSAQEWVDVAATIKGLPSSSPLLGEEWSSGPYCLLTATAAFAESLDALEAGRSPADGYPMRQAPEGRTAVEVLPHGGFDRLLLNGFHAEVWTKPGDRCGHRAFTSRPR